MASCANGKYIVTTGDTCASVYAKVYCQKPALFTKYNGYACTSSRLTKGQVLCKPLRNGNQCS